MRKTITTIIAFCVLVMVTACTSSAPTVTSSRARPCMVTLANSSKTERKVIVKNAQGVVLYNGMVPSSRLRRPPIYTCFKADLGEGQVTVFMQGKRQAVSVKEGFEELYIDAGNNRVHFCETFGPWR